MTPEEMRVAICSKLPNTICQRGDSDIFFWPDSSAEFNPCNDLNAMHEALSKCIYCIESIADDPDNLIAKFETELCNRVTWPLHATAIEYAEAFCRVFWPEKFNP